MNYSQEFYNKYERENNYDAVFGILFSILVLCYLAFTYVSYKMMLYDKIIKKVETDTKDEFKKVVYDTRKNHIINYCIIKGFVEHNNTYDKYINIINENEKVIKVQLSFHKKPWYFFKNEYIIDFNSNKITETSHMYSLYSGERFNNKYLEIFHNNFDKFEVKDETKYDKQTWNNTRDISDIL